MPDTNLVVAIGALEHVLAHLRLRHMLIGGMAVIARGVRRLTDDVDATVWAEGVDVAQLLAALIKGGIAPRVSDALAFARKSQVLLLRHVASGVDIDLSLAWLPFEDAALARATPVRMGNLQVRAALPEDLIVYKAVAGRSRDRSDVERLLELHGSMLPLDEVRRVVKSLALALERPEIADELEGVIRKVLGAPRTKQRRVATHSVASQATIRAKQGSRGHRTSSAASRARKAVKRTRRKRKP